MFKSNNLVSEEGFQLVKLRFLGLGHNLPTEVCVGDISVSITWKWRPQVYCFKILREQTNLRYQNQRYGNYLRASLWSPWLLFRLISNGLNPLKGFLSGRSASLNIPSNNQAPNFSSFERDLVILRSVGKSGLILNEYSSFLEVKLVRNNKYSVITDLKVSVIQRKPLVRLYSQFIIPFIPYLLDSKFGKFITGHLQVLYPIWHPYRSDFSGQKVAISQRLPKNRREIGPNRIFVEENVSIKNGKILLDSEGNLIEFDQDLLSQTGGWPQRAWRVPGSTIFKLPESLEPSFIQHATFIYSVNNLYHFIEDTLPQIEINNLQSPEKPVLIGGNLDSVLREIAICVSRAPVKFIRDEEHHIIGNLTFFYLEKYRSDLAQGKKINLAEHANLIRECIKRINLLYPQEGSATEKLYVVRKKGLQRKLSNFNSVQKTLKNMGFNFIDFEGLSLSERIKLLRNCKILVGESGAGLAHAYLLRPNSRVVEVRHPSMDSSLEHETLVETNFLHYSILNSSYTRSMSRFVNGKDSFKADLDALRDFIEE